MTSLQRPCLGVRLPDNSWEGCGELVDRGRSRCRRHELMNAAARPTPKEKGYDKEYLAERARILAPDPRTGEPPRCELRLPGCTIWATTADHVFERVDGERLPDRLGGRLLRPACAHCNSARRGQRTPDFDELASSPAPGGVSSASADDAGAIAGDDDSWMMPP